jgi:hypothetical protein
MVVVGLCWMFVLFTTLGGGFVMLETYLLADSAPQQAAGAAMAAGIVIVPYVFTRAIEGLMLANRDLNARDAKAAEVEASKQKNLGF